MASFDKHINNCARLDWRILINGSFSLYYDKYILEKDVKWLNNNSYRIHVFDFNFIKNMEDFHETVKVKLGFPEYYGKNFPALNDCLLHDLEIDEIGGTVIVFTNFDEFYKKIDDAHEILECLDLASRRRIVFGDRLIVLIHISNKETKIRGVGSHFITSQSIGR